MIVVAHVLSRFVMSMLKYKAVKLKDRAFTRPLVVELNSHTMYVLKAVIAEAQV